MHVLIRPTVALLLALPLAACGNASDSSDSDSSGSQPRLSWVSEECDVNDIGEFDGSVMHLTQGNAVDGYNCVLSKLDIEDRPWNDSSSSTGSYEVNGLKILWSRSYIGFETNYGDPRFESTFPDIDVRDIDGLTWDEHYETYGDGTPASEAAAASAAASRSSEPEPVPTFLLQGRLTLRSNWKTIGTAPDPAMGGTQDICTDTGAYSAIEQGSGVLIRDPKTREVIGRGDFGTGVVDGGHCEFIFAALDVPAGLPSYRLSGPDDVLEAKFTESQGSAGAEKYS